MKVHFITGGDLVKLESLVNDFIKGVKTESIQIIFIEKTSKFVITILYFDIV